MIEIHPANAPFETVCSECGALDTEARDYFSVRVGIQKFVLCYHCLEQLARQCGVFLFKKGSRYAPSHP